MLPRYKRTGKYRPRIGSAEYNQHLSQLRAAAVRTYLIGKGVAEGRLDAIGIGEEKSIASNDSTAGRAANRRVEFMIVEEGDGSQ